MHHNWTERVKFSSSNCKIIEKIFHKKGEKNKQKKSEKKNTKASCWAEEEKKNKSKLERHELWRISLFLNNVI